MAEMFPRTMDVIRQGIAHGLHAGAQLYVSRNGQPVVDTGVGQTSETINLWLSAGKPIAAVAIAQLFDREELLFDDPISLHIPEFASHGKESITIRHLLTHTAGLRHLANSWSPGPWDQMIAEICSARPEPNWVPGEKAGYHPASSWYLLGEIVRRVSGQAFDLYAREHIFDPLGMVDSSFTLTPERYRAYGDRIAMLHPQWSSEEYAQLLRPGAGFRAPAHDMGKFYEALIDPAIAQRKLGLSPSTLQLLTTPQRIGMFDHTFHRTMDWSLGFIINSSKYADDIHYGFGPHASPRAFGHGGQQSSVAFADPAHNLVVALAFLGMPGEHGHDLRLRATLGSLYEDLK